MEISSILTYNTDSAICDLGGEIVFRKTNPFMTVLKKAVELQAHIIVRSSYICHERPGQYYIKGYKNKKTYDEIKQCLDDNLRDNKYTKVKTWLIQYEKPIHKYVKQQ